jgi:hypothetical protein
VRAKRHTFEQIVAKLRKAEPLQGEGLTIPQTCKRLGISDRPSTTGAPATAP